MPWKRVKRIHRYMKDVHGRMDLAECLVGTGWKIETKSDRSRRTIPYWTARDFQWIDYSEEREAILGELARRFDLLRERCRTFLNSKARLLAFVDSGANLLPAPEPTDQAIQVGGDQVEE